MDWFWWVGTISSALITASLIGAFRWLRRPRGTMEISQGQGWPCRASARWVGSGEAWDVALMPVLGDVVDDTGFRTSRLVHGDDPVRLVMEPDELGRAVVQVMWRSRLHGRRTAGRRLDMASRRWVALSHRDLKKPLPR